MTSIQPFSPVEATAWARLVAVSELLPTMLDAQLLRDVELTHFEYLVLSVLAASPEHTSRMTRLASQTNATLPRLSHVARRLEQKGLLERFPCPQDKRATNARVTAAGLSVLEQAAPGHVATVRSNVLDVLEPAELEQLAAISSRILARLDPEGRMSATQCDAAARAGSDAVPDATAAVPA
ncbi:MarR family winged helix-turn-helix transcriptional regulator [Agromyces aureus]|uniref:MarR family transcriptional regulator n=1 Tax=Agromyces aureus TaxID=453304 RepID=A0A191WCK8_9MICO|nr:MarR family transcriptional regulator [Agromyces aureus]ANJ26000.1 MarR family transcriptional regulator [Agromyces aureus]